ncbi:hypothetical protein TTHERM_00670570 (macronuclear) [Tetrahymena thermophila SB210]|uniref:DUF218 domain-containing protein n=1 Tax=Tetrahymena thermophila (strain SB210) TaxID=312017 RepID=I7MAT9_TETTS|nr:hypothetical protein TTHERM_00670570 [Tetrahymena thermophila SB210]EAS06133.2 hypothetical protein TTHERM_00670570 [Tetrahymena thermophila SB210]|eukprot:XP_001026378.2 hypothetical protein TTHERM_00670570 [Tetrahymena thermophila SB210]
MIKMEEDQTQQCQLIKVFLCLGYALHKDALGNIEMQGELKQRLDYLVENIKQSQFEQNVKTENHSIIVVSGRGKVDIESQYMENYLIEKHKIQKDRILVEKYSMNTVENFLFSFYELWNRFEKSVSSLLAKNKINIELIVITSDFHVKRVQYIAEASLKVLLPAFKNCYVLPLKFLGSPSHSGKTEEAAILWEKAQEKINRILNFQFDLNTFMAERQLTEEDKNNFILFINLIKK